MAEEKKLVGKISHFYGKVMVAIVDLEDGLAVGDEISIEGATTNFKQKVESMQIEHENLEKAVAGQSIGLKVNEKAKENDKVYKIAA